MTYFGRPVLLDFLLSDGSTIEARPYIEVDDKGRLLREDATTLLIPVRDTTASTWPDRVIGSEGLCIRREGHPHDRIPATARWATPEELAEQWEVARTALAMQPHEPPRTAGIVIVDLDR